MDILYKKIKEVRLARGYSQEELALKVGYTGRSAVNRVESGLVDLPRDKIKAFAEALEVSETYLMGITDATTQEETMLYMFRKLTDKEKTLASHFIQGLLELHNSQKEG